MSIDIAMNRLKAANPAPDPGLCRDQSETLDVLLDAVWQRATGTDEGQPFDTGTNETSTVRRGWIVAAATIAVIGVIGVTFLLARGELTTPPSGPYRNTPIIGDSTTPGPTLGVYWTSGDLADGRHSVLVEGVALSFDVAARNWEPYGSLLVTKSFVGPQGAEAVIFWTGYPDGTYADPCFQPDGRSRPAEVAAALAADPGVELISGPIEVLVGGLPAQHVVVRVIEDLGCDPGYFYNWKAQTGGAMWTKSEVGDTIRVWIIDMAGRMTPIRRDPLPPGFLDVPPADHPLLFIAAETHPDLVCCAADPARAESEIQQIIDSIRFDE